MAEKTILVIDDDIDLVEIIRVTLENEGFAVIDAQNGERGLAKAREKAPDLILLDVMMGRVDEGFQVAYQLRGDAATKEIPILMLTAVATRPGSTSIRPGRGVPAGGRVPGEAGQPAQAGGPGAQAPADEHLGQAGGSVLRTERGHRTRIPPSSSPPPPCGCAWTGSTSCAGAPAAASWPRCSWSGVGCGYPCRCARWS